MSAQRRYSMALKRSSFSNWCSASTMRIVPERARMTSEYVVAAPQRLPAEDARVDVIFSAVFLVPFLVLLIVLGWIVTLIPRVGIVRPF